MASLDRKECSPVFPDTMHSSVSPDTIHSLTSPDTTHSPVSPAPQTTQTCMIVRGAPRLQAPPLVAWMQRLQAWKHSEHGYPLRPPSSQLLPLALP